MGEVANIEDGRGEGSFRRISMATMVSQNAAQPKYIPQATALIRGILEQITANDAPIGNEMNNKMKFVQHPPKVSVRTSVGINLPSDGNDVEIQRTTTLDTDLTEPNLTTNSSSLNAQNNLLEGSLTNPNLSLTKMGHTSLASLCFSTLKEVDPFSSSGFAEAPESRIVDTNRTESVSPTKKNQSPRRRNKMFTMTRQKLNVNHRQFAEEKKDDDAVLQHPRLQLFGSEYARHLSSCQLAPITTNKPVKSSRRKQFPRSRCVLLEESKSDYQTGALLDIVVTCNDDPAPPSYFRISQTASGGSAAFGGLHCMYLNVKKEALWDKAAQRPCVTALTLIFPDRQEFVPPGFCIVRLASNGQPANLNQFNQGRERVYLCLRRSREGNPITGLLPLIASLGESIPVGYTVIEHSPRNLTATFAAVTGEAMFLAYRQRLANLETLRPSPLVQTVVKAAQDLYYPQNRIFLMSYFATGGTTVESAIGRFHILDRSTHSLLSPSSIANRLNLIEMSRRKGVDENGNVITPPLTYARSDCGESDTGSNSSYASVDKELQRAMRSKAGGSLADFPIHEKTIVQEMNDSISECSTVLKEGQDDESKGGNLSTLLSSTFSDNKFYGCLQEEDTEVRLCMEAMSFIPQIESMSRNESDSELLKVRIRLLIPVLTACYTRHGGAALLAVEGLTMLLTKTDFFQDDVNLCLDDTRETDSRITLLDLCIQVVSDVATTGSHEAVFASCLEFATYAVTSSQAQLNMRTIGYVLRLYLFVFYFDASIPRKQSEKCPPLSWRPFSMYHEQDFPMLYDPRNDSIKGGSYLLGGAPQAAVLALKELVSLSIERLGKISVAGLLVVNHTASNKQTSEGKIRIMNDAYIPLLDDVLSSLVDNSVDLVERANYTQLALHQIHRSGGSELFWHDMIYACGDGLFSKDKNLTKTGKEMFILLFAILQQLVKVSSGKLRPSCEGTELLPKDVASKLLAFELLLFFLEFWSDEQEAIRSMSNVNEGDAFQSIDTLMFAVRRTVTPCLLWNTRAGLENPQVFRRVIRIVSEMWCSPIYRKNCKVELGILIDHFAAKILELGPQCLFKHRQGSGVKSLLPQQIELIREIKNWLSNDPKDVVEFFLNYDTDITEGVTGQHHFLQGTRWQLFQRISAGLSGIAERCGELIGNQILQNQSIILSLADKYNNAKSHILSSRDEAKRDAIDKAGMREAARDLRKVSLDAIAEIVKNLAISAAAGSGNRLLKLTMSWSPTEVPISYDSRDLSHAEQKNDIQDKRSSQKPMRLDGGGETMNVNDQMRPFAELTFSTIESLETAFEIVEQKSLKKAVEYLIACNILTPSPRDVANFLRFHEDKIGPIALGQYLGENGNGGSESEYWNSIRYLFIRAISFIGMNVDEG
jgi:Guanine nucleotide exchange factor in Golgi transport N-terminal/Sec7 domain